MSCPTRQELLDAIHGVADAAGIEAHLRACDPCRGAYDGLMAATEALARAPYAAPAGPCLREEQLIAYARRRGESRFEDHLSACPKCRAEATALVEALDAEPDAVSEDLERRVLSIVPQPRSAPRSRRSALARIERRGPSPIVWIAAAAAALLAVVVILSLPKPPEAPVVRERAPAPQKEVVKEETPAPKPVVKEEAPKPIPEPPKKEEPKPLVVEPPKKEEPKPVVIETPKKEEPKKEEPKPVVVEPAPKKTEIDPVKHAPVVVSLVAGGLSRKSGAAVEKIAATAELARADQVFTDHRRPAHFRVGADYMGYLGRNSTLRVEQVEGGETRVTLVRGEAFFKVEKRPLPFVVATPHGESIVVGTAFQVDLEEKRTILSVLEGTVRLKNEKGETVVKAGQRSTVRAGEKPGAAARWDVESETAWHRRLDLASSAAKDPFIDHEPGANKKLPGVVVATPYSEWETDSGKLARLTAELLDVGLVAGHHHRDRVDKKIWLNIDRGTEGDVRPDGTLSQAYATDRAKKVTAEYLGHLKAAAGVAADKPVALAVHVREHSEMQGGEELEVCEVALAGFNKKAVQQLKAFYVQLLDKHKPAYRVEMRFEGLDDAYDYKGRKRTFLFTESDAEADGYMARRHAQAAVCFFFNASFGKRAEDFDAYSKILGELIEFLYRSR